LNTRAAAALTLQAVIYEGTSLTEALAVAPANAVALEDRGLLRDLCFGSLRWHERLSALLKLLVTKPLKAADKDVECLLRIGLYQLLYQRIPSHAAVNETVKAVKALKKPWADKLVNGVLRNFLREQANLLDKIDSQVSTHYAFPTWLLKELQSAWPAQWTAIVAASNTQAAMTLRVNQRHFSTAAYQALLQEQGIQAQLHAVVPSALVLEKAVGVEQLPAFAQGAVSVQDAAAQLAAFLLDAQPNMRVLDACAAPGGKTTHVLERSDHLALIALDSSESRLSRVHENLARLQLNAEVITADAGDLTQWWDGQYFDRILLDAPCSATGVMRRHPDIKLLRRANDIPALQQQQQQLLQQLWQILKPGGTLLYATCSILPQENVQQITQFMQTHTDAEHVPLEGEWGTAMSYGRQILPGDTGMDGFYYALLLKQVPKAQEHTT
jgi:16S rRNA (cytosine967-C5)-methyltransferase